MKFQLKNARNVFLEGVEVERVEIVYEIISTNDSLYLRLVTKNGNSVYLQSKQLQSGIWNKMLGQLR